MMSPPGPQHPLLKKRAWLVDQLITRGKTSKVIGEEIGVSDNTVIRAAHFHAIDIRKLRRLRKNRLARHRPREPNAYWPGHGN